MRRATLIALALLIGVLPAAAASGDLDRSFSGDGWVRTYDIFGYSKAFFPKGAEDVAIQPDGKILAVSELQDGNSHWWFGVYRWLPNGDLDRSFGSGGWVANDLGIFPMPTRSRCRPTGRSSSAARSSARGSSSASGSSGITRTARSTAASECPAWRGPPSRAPVRLRAPRPGRAEERPDRRGRMALPGRRRTGRHAARRCTLPAGWSARPDVLGRRSFLPRLRLRRRPRFGGRRAARWQHRRWWCGVLSIQDRGRLRRRTAEAEWQARPHVLRRRRQDRELPETKV